MFLDNFLFVVPHLKIKQAVYINVVEPLYQLDISYQRLIEKNNLSVGNVNTPATRFVLGYYILYRLLTFRSKLGINLLFCF